VCAFTSLTNCFLTESLRLDHGICEAVKPIITASQAQLHDLQRSHHEKTLVISGNADRSLGDDYKVSRWVWVPVCLFTAHVLLA
jgi:hypothetical protein